MNSFPWYSSLPEALSSITNEENPSVQKESSLGGGCISTANVLTLESGKRIFMKSNGREFEKMFRTEAAGLVRLSEVSEGPAVPRVYCGGTEGGRSFLLMEYIQPGRKSLRYSEGLGRSLANLHKFGRDENCGFSTDNFIGATPQENTPHPDWIGFFRTRRLEYQLRLARNRGLADSRMTSEVGRVLDRLDRYLIPCDDGKASLLHGDLWGGNVICGTDGEAVIIDPAVYYGHREADLAMTELFGGFDSAFYRSYNETWPLREGYSVRKDLYNLYHMLNHLNIFGSSYAGSVLSIARKYST